MSPDDANGHRHVIVIGGGFAGVGCVRRLARQRDVRVTLLDRNNYHQFQPLLYQVATSQLAPSDIAYSLRKLFQSDENVHVRMADVASIDPEAHAVTTTEGERIAGDALVLAAGSQPNFFHTPGAEEHAFPLYSLDDAQRLRSRILSVFEEADRDPSLIAQGALNFVVVGGGPTGVELAGALADLIHDTITGQFPDLPVTSAQIHLVDLGHTLLGPFSDKAHDYVAKILGRKGVRIHLGVAVTEVGAGHVTLGDGTTIRTRCVVWGGGIMAPPLAAASGLPRGRGGRIDVLPDLTVDRRPRRLRDRRCRQHPRAARRLAPAAGLGRAAERDVGGRQPRRRRRRQAAALVPLPRQGDHGDDRPRRGDRGGGGAPARAARRDRVLRVAGRARDAHEWRAQPRRRVHHLGLGLLHEPPRAADPRSRRRGADRLAGRQRA